MDQCTKDWIDVVAKVVAALGVGFAALNYWSQTKTKRAEWLKSLFEKFYEKNEFKEVRKWIESKEIEIKIDSKKEVLTEEDEKFADYLNFFEFIATLKDDWRLKKKDVLNMFDYYLKKLKESPKCMEWINNKEYGFEKLRNLLNKVKI